MTHHILHYSADHDPRVPHFLRGQFAPVRLERYTDHNKELSRHWNAAERRYVFETPLWFVSDEIEIDLDYYPVCDGFLASDRLIAILHDHRPDGLRIHPVRMSHENGQPNTLRAMHFCQVRDRRAACDLAQMDIDGAYHRELDGPNRTQILDGRTVIACAQDLTLRSDLPAWFEATDIASSWCLVNEAVRRDLAAADLRGLHSVDTSDIVVVDFMPGPMEYSLHAPQWRRRGDLELWRAQLGQPVRARFFDPAKASDDPEIQALIAAAKARLEG